MSLSPMRNLLLMLLLTAKVKVSEVVTFEETVQTRNFTLNGIDSYVNISEHVAKLDRVPFLALRFANCSVFRPAQSQHYEGYRQISGLREYEIKRYISDGRTNDFASNKWKRGGQLMRDGKVQRIEESKTNPGVLKAKVIGTSRGAHRVAVQFQPAILSTDNPVSLTSSRDILCSECSHCGLNAQCSHIAAVLLSLRDCSPLGRPTRIHRANHFQVTSL